MNILMLTSELYPNWGGIGTYVSELARNMPDDATIHIATPRRTRLGTERFKGEGVLGELPENVCIHYLGAARDTFMHYFYFMVACRLSVPALVKMHDIDIIHSQNTMPDLFLYPQRLGVPIVTTVHTIERERLPVIRAAAACSGRRISELERSEKMPLLLSHILSTAERAYYGNERYYIAVSQWTKEQVLRRLNVDAKRIHVVHNGVDSTVFTQNNADQAQQHFPSLADIEAPKILFLSRLTTSKGVHMLMKAIPLVLREADAHFIFAGPGELPPHDHPNNVTELGYVDHRITPSLYASADVFALPSFYENFPLTILEAMATGRAVVASNVGGIPEMISHGINGLLVRSGSVGDIADALTTLIRDDELRTMLGRNARLAVEDRFNWGRVAADVFDYYTWVLNENSSNQSAATSWAHAGLPRRSV
jgi:glycosyltransferase involved in cell wall biosynthesis